MHQQYYDANDGNRNRNGGTWYLERYFFFIYHERGHGSVYEDEKRKVNEDEKRKPFTIFQVSHMFITRCPIETVHNEYCLFVLPEIHKCWRFSHIHVSSIGNFSVTTNNMQNLW